MRWVKRRQRQRLELEKPRNLQTANIPPHGMAEGRRLFPYAPAAGAIPRNQRKKSPGPPQIGKWRTQSRPYVPRDRRQRRGVLSLWREITLPIITFTHQACTPSGSAGQKDGSPRLCFAPFVRCGIVREVQCAHGKSGSYLTVSHRYLGLSVAERSPCLVTSFQSGVCRCSAEDYRIEFSLHSFSSVSTRRKSSGRYFQ
jgi:hypothetical protein